MRALQRLLSFYTRRQWRIAAILFLSYVAVSLATMQYLPASTGLRPAIAIALVALFFGGVRLWPVVYAAALTSALMTGAAPLLVIAIPISVSIQASLGAYLLRRARLDPIFRRYRDMLSLAGTTIIISTLLPTAVLIVNALRDLPFSAADWGRYYIASAFCLIILTPLLLRWFTKPRFSRSLAGTFELLAIFGVLIGISVALFIYRIPNLAGVSLIYFLLIPLFWIALRLRPRFVTLAIFIIAMFGIVSTIMYGNPTTLPQQLLGMEMFLIVIAAIFLTITSVEEDRRVNTNIMHSQMETLENALARISSESRAKNDFIAILAHELRNPLAPVVSAIDLLKLKGARDAEDAEALTMMSDRMDVVRRLLDDLLDISRISEGKVALKREPVNIEAVLEHAALSTEHYRKEHHQRFALKKPEVAIQVAGDAVRLEQIFSNLLTNASKYSHSGDTITVEIRPTAGFVDISVSDNGIGLSAHEIETIFLPFQQVEQGERTMKGLGIGLALVRSFVEMHDGTISAASHGHGKGSTFTVRLPILSSAVPVKGIRAGIASMMAPRATDGPCILIVDDNDAAAGSMGRLLELRGCTVVYAYNGTDAIEHALTIQPDVVLLDVGLPDIDGYTVARRLRTQGFTGLLIALTGYSTDEAKKLGMDAGFDHYLVKPTGLADLRRVIPGLS